jgi:anti-sigma factor RsiW
MMFETPDDCAANAAAYVLGALEAGEAAAYERHLQACTICAEQIAVFRRVTDALATVAPPHRVWARLRRRVLRAARTEFGPR